MFELLAAILHADPSSLTLWGILLLSAGMYPVGFMLGSSCSPCCACKKCEEGFLPDTLTVTFDNLPAQTKSGNLCVLSFASCFGSGAAGHATAPGGNAGVDDGPITAVSLTNAGSGYAKLGRVSPTVTASGSGSSATLSVTLTKSQDACNVDYWSVSGVTVTAGGTGYTDSEPVTFSVATGDTEEVAASATINTSRSAPTLTATASGGSSGTLSVATTSSGTPTTWAISSISVTAGGTGYTDNTSVTIAKDGNDVEVSPAYANIRTGRAQPTLSASITSSGSSASITATLTKATDYEGRDVWNITGFTIGTAGSGYSVGDPVTITVTDGQESYYSYFQASVSSVDGSGGVTGIQIDYGGEYFKDTGVIESVTLFSGGSYYSDDGIVDAVTVNSGGVYYREDASQPPYVADVTVTVNQSAPSAGAGAEISATVEDDTASADFGKIVALTIDDGGDDYLAWAWRNTRCCGDYYNGMSVVLQRSSTDPCQFVHSMCGVGNRRNYAGLITLVYEGPSTPPTLVLQSEVGPYTNHSAICNTAFTATENVTDCSVWEDVPFTGPGGETATVTAGGTYSSEFRNKGIWSCNICCKGDSPMPLEVSVNVQDNRVTKGFDYSADYVVPMSGFNGTFSNGVLLWVSRFYIGTPAIEVNVGTVPCSTQTGTEFGEDENGCDDCHKKCRFTSRVIISESGNLDSQQTSNLYLYSPDDYCVACQVTPICGPVGQSETLCEAVFGGACDFIVTVNEV